MNATSHAKAVKSATISWLCLLLLTCISVYLDNFTENYVLFISAALVIVFIKGQQIVDIFMELNTAPKLWRLLFLSYVFLIPTIIGLIYIL